MKTRERTPDLIRLIATLLVVVVHTRGFFFSGSTSPISMSVLRVLGTLGVPLFVILTGYLMFDRPYEQRERLEHFVTGNLLSLVVAFECWNILWWALEKVEFIAYPGGGFPRSFEQVAKAALFVGDTGTALWYLPMTIGLYLGLPMASIALRRCLDVNRRYVSLVFGLAVLFGTLVPSVGATLQYFGHPVDIHSVLTVNVFGASVWGDSVWMLYLLAGWGIRRGWLRRVPSGVLASAGVALPLVLAFVTCYLQELGIGEPAPTGYSFIFYVVSSVCVFELIVRQEGKLVAAGNRLGTWLGGMSKTSFGTYMVHLFVVGAIYHLGVPQACLATPITLAWVLYLLILVGVLYACHAIVLLLGKSRVVAHWLLLMK